MVMNQWKHVKKHSMVQHFYWKQDFSTIQKTLLDRSKVLRSWSSVRRVLFRVSGDDHLSGIEIALYLGPSTMLRTLCGGARGAMEPSQIPHAQFLLASP